VSGFRSIGLIFRRVKGSAASNPIDPDHSAGVYYLEIGESRIGQLWGIVMSSSVPKNTLTNGDGQAETSTEDLANPASQTKTAGQTSSIVEEPFKPSKRAPLAVLTVMDDGQKTGQIIRIRNSKFWVGRSEGNLLFPDDHQISARHISISKENVNGSYRLVIADLQSRNGLFVKVSRAPLEVNAEVILGRGRYRLEMVDGDSDGAFGSSTDLLHDALTELEEGSKQLVFYELLTRGIGDKLSLEEGEYWVGRTADCAVRRPTDTFLADKHAVIKKSARGVWMIENNQSINGIWLRTMKLTIDCNQQCEFRIGEQIFHIRFG